MASKVYEELYKGHPTMVIEGNFKNQKGEDFTVKFKFGVTKAKLLMEHIPDVEAFIKKNSEGDFSGYKKSPEEISSIKKHETSEERKA